MPRVIERKKKHPTLAVNTKRKMCKTKTKVVSIESSKELFSKIAIIAQKRKVDLKLLFSYPLGAVPLLLEEVDATLKKKQKAALLHRVEGKVEPITQIPVRCTFIVGGMAAVRQMKVTQMSYKMFAEKLLNQILSAGNNARWIDVVFDT